MICLLPFNDNGERKTFYVFDFDFVFSLLLEEGQQQKSTAQVRSAEFMHRSDHLSRG